MELVLEQTQQGTSYEVSVSAEGVEELKRKVKIKGEKKEALLIPRQKLGQYIRSKMEILLEPTSNKLLEPTKGISQNFSSPCTPEQNGVVERRNITIIEAAKTMLNSAKLPKQFWGEAVNIACYTQNISIIVKRHGKTSYDVFRGRSHDISYFHVFGCLVHIHNHRVHLGKFNEKDDYGFFLGYSLVAKAFRVFNIERQEMEEIVHVTFSEDEEAISQSSTEGDAINFNENRSFPDDEFLEPRSEVTQCPGSTDSSEPDQTKLADHFELVVPQNNVIIEPISDVQPSPTIPPSAEVILQTPVPQDRWSREKQIELVNIIGEPLAGITTISRIRDSDAASAFKCLYVNFISEMEPKKLIEALEEEGWIIVIHEELNQFERNSIDYEETFAPVARLEAIRIFLAYATYMGFIVYQMDVKSAFLNGKISEEVHVQQPPGFESSEFPNHVCKLDKALYGLKQAPRAWYETLSKFLIQHKFVRGTIDNTLFTYKTKSEVIIVQIYVDDIIFGSTSDKMSKQFAKLMTKKYEMSMMGELTYFLGFQIKQDFKGISICQEKYVKDLLKKYDLVDISNNPVLHSRTKHIDIMYHFIRDHILKGDIKLHFVPTNLQLANIFTKPLAEPSFTRLVVKLGMLNIEK
ncbi:retrovirus-related pol polyprotein from transposon TNT 1-94 [Tanacetum coccineum]